MTLRLIFLFAAVTLQGEYAAKAIDDIAMEWIISHDLNKPTAVFTVTYVRLSYLNRLMSLT